MSLENNSLEQNQFDDEISLIDLFVVLLRRRWLIIGCTCIAAILGLVAYLVLPDQQYSRSSTDTSLQAVNEESFLTTTVYSMNSALFAFEDPERVKNIISLVLNNPETLLGAYRDCEIDTIGEISLTGTDKLLIVDALRKRIANKTPLNSNNDVGSWILNIEILENGFVSLTIKSNDSDQAFSILKSLKNITNAEIKTILAPAAESEIAKYLEFSSLKSSTNDFDSDGITAYYNYKDAQYFLNGSENALMFVQSDIKLLPKQPLSLVISEYKKEIKGKIVLSVLAVFFLSIILSFVIQAMENVKNDPVSIEKIKKAMGKKTIMPLITIRDLVKTYLLGSVEVNALRGISLDINGGDFVSVAGPSGSGKTTIMNMISLIDTPTSGHIRINDQDTAALRRRDLTRLRHIAIGIVFQSFNLLPVLNVTENVELPLVIGKNSMPKKERREWVSHLLKEVGLEKRMTHKPSELSGGQQQRVAIARALATKPQIVIADEPTANLDSSTGEMILNLMKEINKTDGTTFIFSTHDPGIWDMADHVVFLRDGFIESEQRK